MSEPIDCDPAMDGPAGEAPAGEPGPAPRALAVVPSPAWQLDAGTSGASTGVATMARPAVQAAAVAAGGFVAGAAVAGLVHRRRRSSAPGRRRVRGRIRRGGSGGAATGLERVQILASRSLLLDVHLLGAAGDR